MGGADTSATRRHELGAVLASAIIRMAALAALTLTYVLGLRTWSPLSRGGLLVAAVVVGSAVYTVFALSMQRRAPAGASLSAVGSAVDAVTATAFFGVALHTPASLNLLLAGVAALAYGLVMTGSMVGLLPRAALVASLVSVLGSSAVVVPLFLSSAGPADPLWGLVPAGCAALGAVSSGATYAAARTLRRNLATEDLRRASRRLRMTMEIVQVSISNLGQLVADLERVSATLSEGARHQARSVERVSNSIGELNTSQEQIYHSAEVSAKTIRKTVDTSDTGNRVVRRVIEEIRSISDTVERMVSSLEQIDDIADNTNLLALNANIEANRGGAESMGFSVVADEIRNLAEQSQDSAIEVGRLVKQIAKVITTADSSSRSAGEIFGKINSDLAGYADYVNSLHHSVQEQLKANRDVQRSVTRISEVTVDNTQAADRVRDIVADLQKEVTKLRDLLEGRTTETAVLS
jgi:methyl-accepting chemotaxis protein